MNFFYSMNLVWNFSKIPYFNAFQIFASCMVFQNFFWGRPWTFNISYIKILVWSFCIRMRHNNKKKPRLTVVILTSATPHPKISRTFPGKKEFPITLHSTWNNFDKSSSYDTEPLWIQAFAFSIKLTWYVKEKSY